MTVLLSVLGLVAVAALTLGTAISVASEFALTALERSQVDAHVLRAQLLRAPLLGAQLLHHDPVEGRSLRRRRRHARNLGVPPAPRRPR